MPTQRPNILLIVLDTTRRDRLSLYGHPAPTTPHLDAFAEGATRYDRAIAAAQWTVPSHASMFTGLYPGVHGVTQSTSVISGMHPTAAEILRGTGYQTVAFCNNPLVGVLNNGLQRGFERFYNYASAAPFRPAEERRHPLVKAALRGFRRRLARPIGNQFSRSDALFRVALNPALTPLWTRLIRFKGDTSGSADDLIDWWKAHRAGGADRPLFAFLNLMGAHLPYNPPQDALRRVGPLPDSAQFRFIRRFNGDAAAWATPPAEHLPEWQRAALDAFYDAEIHAQDSHLGRLFKWLHESGTLANTLVIICADHGEGHGDHGFFGHGFVTYQELVHVPLVIHWPEGAGAGQVEAGNVSTRRIFHTLLAAAGVYRPPLDENDPNADVGGLALSPPSVDANLTAGDEVRVYSEAYPPSIFLGVIEHRNASLIARLALGQPRRALYQGDHKLVTVGDQTEGLFYLPDDPAEVVNRAGDEPERIAGLQRDLQAFVVSHTARRPESATFTLDDSGTLDHLRALGYIE
jgi:arylsulfatase A-like enzyme